MPIPELLLARMKLKKPDLTHLDLSDYGLDDSDVDVLHETISDNPYIVSVDLSRNNLTYKSMRTLSLLLNTVSKLDLQNNYIDDESLQVLLLKNKNSKLKWLNISDNNLSNASASFILEKMKDKFCPLKYVDVSKNRKIDEENRVLILKISRENLAIKLNEEHKLENKDSEKSKQFFKP